MRSRMCHKGTPTGDSRMETQNHESRKCNVVKVKPNQETKLRQAQGNEGKSDQKRKDSNDACSTKDYSAKVTLSIVRLLKQL